jgi:hypothetical protein
LKSAVSLKGKLLHFIYLKVKYFAAKSSDCKA